MKFVAKLSAWVVFAALVCFAPGAFGQGVQRNAASGTASNVRYFTPASLLAFTFGPGGGHNSGGNGCSQGGNGGWDDRGRGGRGNNGDGCTQVPEGGTATMYLLLAGFCCLGGLILRSRLQAGARKTN